MPRDNRRKKGPAANKGNFQDYTFVEVRINQADKAAFHAWAKDHADDSVDLLSAVVNSGHKLSASWSDYNDCFTVSLTGTEEASPNFHHVMTSRSDDLFEAIMIALYKHLVMCPDGEWPTDRQTNDWG